MGKAWLTQALQAGRAATEHWLIERRCASCEVALDRDWLCDPCRTSLAPVPPCCPRCAMTIGPYVRADPKGCAECRGRPLGFDGAVALGRYDGAIRGLCLALKQSRAEVAARRVADLLAQSRSQELRGLGADLVVPVPLFWWARWRRGYNQAEALAAGLAGALGLEWASPLRRIRATRKLARLSPTAREKELKGSMALSRWSGRRVEGRTVLLVDDVLTTGATCGEAARVLKRGGASRVVVAVLGRAAGA